jgi:hypothetical protein
MVKRLILISPRGVIQAPPDFSIDKYVSKVDGYFKRKMAKTFCEKWENGSSFFDVIRKTGPSLANKLFEKFAKAKLL